MADPISLAVTVATIIAKVFTLSKDTWDLAQEIRNAPSHMKALTRGIEDFHSKIEIIQEYVENQESTGNFLKETRRNDLGNSLEQCLGTLQKISALLKSFQTNGGNPRIWDSLKYTFKKSTTEELRRELEGCKTSLTLTMVVSNFTNADRSSASSSPESDTGHTRLDQLEDALVARLSPGKNPALADLLTIEHDPNFNTRRFLYAQSVRSNHSAAPSIQVSSFGSEDFKIVPNLSEIDDKEMGNSSYGTAQTHVSESAASLTGKPASEHANIFVKGPDNNLYRLHNEAGPGRIKISLPPRQYSYYKLLLALQPLPEETGNLNDTISAAEMQRLPDYFTRILRPIEARPWSSVNFKARQQYLSIKAEARAYLNKLDGAENTTKEGGSKTPMYNFHRSYGQL